MCTIIACSDIYDCLYPIQCLIYTHRHGLYYCIHSALLPVAIMDVQLYMYTVTIICYILLITTYTFGIFGSLHIASGMVL